MMRSPIANNIISIASWQPSVRLRAGQPAPHRFIDQQELLLGLGPTLGIIAQAIVLIPYLKAVG